jgi:glutathione S-transferase
MKLYHAPGSCSQAICIVLQETGLNADIIKVDARKHLLESGASYDGINELGYVPLLELDDGTFLREGPVIAQYLADQRPESGMAPAHGTMERYRLLEWLNFLTSEVHKGFIPLLYAIRRCSGKIYRHCEAEAGKQVRMDKPATGWKALSDGRKLHDC